jgi:hypothetical protein
MNIPLSIELGDTYFDLMDLQAKTDFDNIRPSDVTRFILRIFDYRDEDLTIAVVHNIIQSLHDCFKNYDNCKLSELSGIDISDEVRELKALFKAKTEETNQ